MNMETFQPALKRGRDVWDKINMPEGEFRQRVEKVRNEMKKAGIDCLLLYGRGANEYGNPSYISNFVIKMPQGALVTIPATGDVTLIVEGFPRDQPAVKKTTWIQDVRSCREVPQACIEYLKENHYIPSTLGFVGLSRFMPYPQYQTLTQSLDQCKLVDANDIIKEMRTLKSLRERDQIQRSSRIINRAFEFVSKSTLPTMNEKVLEATLDYAARIDGAEDIRILMAKPLESDWAMRPAEDAHISSGESFITYLAVAFERYWSEGIRTYIADETSFKELPSETPKALYERILGMVKPGKSISQFCSETIKEVKKSPMEYLPRYGLGQGIGLSLQEPPLITKEETHHFVEGMCFTLRLTLKEEKSGDFMIGDTIFLSKESPEVLTS